MIEEIRINDLGVISEATLPLGPGFTVVTGETGAGKTMVVTALGMLLGNRADAGAVRHGAKQAVAEASLRLPAQSVVIQRAEEAGALVEEDDDVAELIIARFLSAAGRSRAAVGGRSAPVGLLAELGHDLVAVHGQSDQLRLTSASAQRGALDNFAGEPARLARDEYAETYGRYRQVQSERAELLAASRERLREAESLQLALEEIDAVDPQSGEDETLKASAAKLANVEALRTAAATAHAALTGSDYAEERGASALIEEAKQQLQSVQDDDAELVTLSRRLEELGYIINDVATEISSYETSLDSEGPEELAALEARRADLGRLIRKYAPTIDDVLVWADEARKRLDELQDDSGRLEALEAEEQELRDRLHGLAERLSECRQDAAAELDRRVTGELAALAMPDARFVTEVTDLEDFGPHGSNEIRMLLQPHTGSAPRPLGKGASGGELSRVMLAIEVVLAEVDPVPTFVFDEVDAGVGGKAAVEIGKRLAMLARHVQVIVVTHLPQVAAFADRHIRVIKNAGAAAEATGGVTASDVVALEDAERVRELARMLAGQEESDTAQAHAEELLHNAQQAVSAWA
ncbi:DNA repair protein RecN [Zhihengliuella flava]|uniref:DNA repair protein RecN n=1 Tax=Zhihengliuella flava TaxID=1285193 RepID=A0A931D4S8_9MICC|nr:DNA repair protein RecN [Zhihengliuella flava]MBG6083725.1 DNA repair protein RecN (Recombination protein N) [Zhihengliuella flava]